MAWHRRRLRFIHRRRIISPAKKSYKILWFGVFLLLLCIWLDYSIRPVITSVAGYQVKTAMTGIINQAVTEVLETAGNYESYVTLSTDQNGEITSIESNTVSINRVQTQVTQQIVDVLSKGENQSVYIPLGTLFGNGLLSGRGPNVEIKIIKAGSVSVVTESRFSSAGINQTLHQIVLKAEIEAKAILPGYSADVVINTEYILAETMVVGKIPDTYAQILGQSETALPYLMESE